MHLVFVFSGTNLILSKSVGTLRSVWSHVCALQCLLHTDYDTVPLRELYITAIISDVDS